MWDAAFWKAWERTVSYTHLGKRNPSKPCGVPQSERWLSLLTGLPEEARGKEGDDNSPGLPRQDKAVYGFRRVDRSRRNAYNKEYPQGMKGRIRMKKSLKKRAAVCLAFVAGIAGTAAIAAGIWMQHKKRSTSISIIGSADGPTSIYIAGKIDGTSLLIPGILLLAAGIVAAVLLRKK